MIYSGYECGHFYVRFTHDVRVLDAIDMFQDGYKLVSGHMLLIKRREAFARDVGGIESETLEGS